MARTFVRDSYPKLALRLDPRCLRACLGSPAIPHFFLTVIRLPGVRPWAGHSCLAVWIPILRASSGSSWLEDSVTLPGTRRSMRLVWRAIRVCLVVRLWPGDEQ
jgi:hypothetical protein